jgi:hypothetical protein
MQSRISASLPIRAVFQLSGVFIVDALPRGDYQTARRLHDDLLHLKNGSGEPFSCYSRVDSAEDWFSVLRQVEKDCLNGYRPILHIEAHGNEQQGVLLGASNTYLSWGDLGESFLRINEITKNNLGVVLAACHGLFHAYQVDILQPCPYAFLVAPDDQIGAGMVDEQMNHVYRALRQTGELHTAFEQLGSSFKKFHAEAFFCNAFADYLCESCFGRGLKDRKERLLTLALEGGAAENGMDKRQIRGVIREHEYEADYKRLSKRFLHGRSTVEYREVLAYARSLLPFSSRANG